MMKENYIEYYYSQGMACGWEFSVLKIFIEY